MKSLRTISNAGKGLSDLTELMRVINNLLNTIY